MPSFSRWAGGASELLTLSASIRLSARVRVQRVAATTTGIEVALPDARRIGSLGGPVLVVWNTGTNPIDVTDDGGTVLGTVGADELAIVFLVSKNDADGEWRLKIEPTDAIPIGGVNDFFTTIGGDSTYIKSPWKYDHSGNSWSAGTDAAANMVESAGIMSAGIGYVPASPSAYPMQQYDPDTWTTLGNASRNPSSRAAAEDAGQGDWYGGNVISGGVALLHDVYSVSGDSWAAGTNVGFSLLDGGADHVEAGTNLVHGGFEFFGSAIQLVNSHDTSGDSFTSKANMTQSRGQHGHFALDGDIFVIAGFGAANGSIIRSTTESYNLAGNAWTARSAWPPGAVGSGPAGATREAGVAYAVGGEGSISGRSYQVDTWTAIADHGVGGAQHRWATESTLALVY